MPDSRRASDRRACIKFMKAACGSPADPDPGFLSIPWYVCSNLQAYPLNHSNTWN